MSGESAADVRDARQPGAISVRHALIRSLWLIAPAALAIALVMPTTVEVIRDWDAGADRPYAHGWLVALICAWLLYRVARDEPGIRHTPDYLGIASMLAVGAAWLIAARTNILVAQFVLLPPLAFAAVAAVNGFETAKRCAFPIAFFYFAVPIWEVLTAPLQWGTIFANRTLVRLTGIPASFDETRIHLPSGTIEVAGGCSGLHFVIVGLMLGALHAHLNGKSLLRSLALAFGLSVLANWIRVFVILLAGHLTNMQHYLVRVDHYKFGWVVFAVTIAIFFWIAERFPAKKARARGEGTQPLTRVGPPTWLLLCAGCTAVVAMPAIEFGIEHREPAPFHELFIASQPLQPANDAALLNETSAWAPQFQSADRLARGRVDWHGTRVDWVQAHYGAQDQSRKLAGERNSVLDPATTLESSAPAEASDWRETIARSKNGALEIVWNTYYVGTRQFMSPLRAQIAYGVESLWGSHPSGVFALRAPCSSDCVRERSMLREITAATTFGPSPQST